MQKLFSAALILVLLSCICPAQKTRISGKVLSCDGKPLLKAAAEVFSPESKKFVQLAVNNDGSFTLETCHKIAHLRLSGVNHISLFLPVFINDSPEVNFCVLLPTNSYCDDFSKIRLIGNFNNWNIESPVPLKKNDNGVLCADIDMEEDTVKYQLVGLSKDNERHSRNGTMSDDYKYDTDGDFISIIYKKGKTAHIEFDPEKLARENSDAVINSDMPNCPEVRVMKEDLKRQKYLSGVKETASIDSTFKPDIIGLAKEIKSSLEQEKDSFVRGYYYFKYFSLLNDFHVFSVVSLETTKIIDPSHFVNGLEEISPSSGYWSYNSGYLYNIGIIYPFLNQKDKYQDYLDRVISMHKDPEVRANALWAKAEGIKNDIKEKRRRLENPRLSQKETMEMAERVIREYKEKNHLDDDQLKERKGEVSKLIGSEYHKMSEAKKGEIKIDSEEIKAFNEDLTKQEEISRQCLERIVREFPSTTRGELVKSAFYTLKKDDPVPKFNLISLEDNKTIFSNTSLKGKYCLIDFWASWCGPCVWTMPDLHELYKKLQDSRKFEILSISLDVDDNAVSKFRKERYPMPWLHARLKKGFEDEAAKNFAVKGIPKMLLISPDGKILANDWSLRGQHFIERIEKLIAEDSSSVK